MLRRGTERLLAETGVTPERLRRMDDKDLLVALRSHEATEGYGERLSYRDLFKRAIWAEMEAVPEAVLKADHEEIRDCEAEIAGEAGVDPDLVILDVPDEPEMKETSSRVIVAGEVRRLEAQSTLVQALRAAQYDQWRLGVYAPEEVSDRVGDAAVRVLGLDVEDTLVSDVRTGVHATLDEFQ
jgi:HD superfamily phosphohydrolase